jgi:hypothetical protein
VSANEPQNIATAMAEVSERAIQLVHEEIELAKAEVTEKTTTLIRGTVVGIAAGVFGIFALVLALEGLAWLAWWALPVGVSEFFWGFFLVAGVLVLFAALAAGLAARAMRAGSPPVPSMALEEARKIRETVSAEGQPSPAMTSSLPGWDPVEEAGTARAPAAPARAPGAEGAESQ